MLIVFLIAIQHSFCSAQDQITRLDGSLINCQITDIDSSIISFTYRSNGKNIETFTETEKLKSFKIYGITYLLNELSKTDLNDFLVKITEKKNNNAAIHFADSLEDTAYDFLYLYSGDIVYGNYISYNKPFLAQKYFLIDDSKFKSNKVKFVKQGIDIYANTSNFSPFKGTTFAKRISTGRINLYQREVIYRCTNCGYSSKRIYNYFNIGFNELKKANYKNLYPQMYDNIECLVQLNRYRTKTILQNSLYIGGFSLIVGSAISIISKVNRYDSNEESTKINETPNIVMIFAGAGIVFIGYGISLSRPGHLKQAFDIYNR